MSGLPSPPATTLDPPFRGYIETTFDALLVFEAARRGMIPRVTRRLIERERSMVQSGAVFVFDEHESGIKRWTDGLVWSPSRILGNFLVYRQTDKGSGNKPTTPGQDISPSRSSPTSTPKNRPNSGDMPTSIPTYTEASGSSSRLPMIDTSPQVANPAPLGQGQLHRPRSSSEGGSGGVDRARERQLVGSLTNSYKFTSGGLVKKTMSVTVNDYAQHMISYYTMDDALAGRLRTPSSIPELAALEIAPEYLVGQSFRFPPRVEVGPDGKPRYRGEPDVPSSPQSPVSAMTMQGFPPNNDYYDPYGNSLPPPHLRLDQGQPRNRSVTVPMPIPMGPNNPGSLPSNSSYMGPVSAGSNYYDQNQLHLHAAPIVRQGSNSSIHSQNSGHVRPTSSSRRYDPYGGPTSPRVGGIQMAQQHSQPSHRRQSQPQAIPIPPDSYYHQQNYDTKPNIGGSYSYQPPSTAPGSFSDFYPHGSSSHPSLPSQLASPSPVQAYPPSTGQQHSHQPQNHQQYTAWPQAPPQSSAPTSRLLPTGNGPREFSHLPNPPSSSGSSGSGGNPHHGDGQGPGSADTWGHHPHAPGGGQAVWESGGSVGYSSVIPHGDEWRGGNMA